TLKEGEKNSFELPTVDGIEPEVTVEVVLKHEPTDKLTDQQAQVFKDQLEDLKVELPENPDNATIHELVKKVELLLVLNNYQANNQNAKWTEQKIRTAINKSIFTPNDRKITLKKTPTVAFRPKFLNIRVTATYTLEGEPCGTHSEDFQITDADKPVYRLRWKQATTENQSTALLDAGFPNVAHQKASGKKIVLICQTNEFPSKYCVMHCDSGTGLQVNSTNGNDLVVWHGLERDNLPTNQHFFLSLVKQRTSLNDPSSYLMTQKEVSSGSPIEIKIPYKNRILSAYASVDQEEGKAYLDKIKNPKETPTNQNPPSPTTNQSEGSAEATKQPIALAPVDYILKQKANKRPIRFQAIQLIENLPEEGNLNFKIDEPSNNARPAPIHDHDLKLDETLNKKYVKEEYPSGRNWPDAKDRWGSEGYEIIDVHVVGNSPPKGIVYTFEVDEKNHLRKNFKDIIKNKELLDDFFFGSLRSGQLSDFGRRLYPLIEEGVAEQNIAGQLSWQHNYEGQDRSVTGELILKKDKKKVTVANMLKSVFNPRNTLEDIGWIEFKKQDLSYEKTFKQDMEAYDGLQTYYFKQGKISTKMNASNFVDAIKKVCEKLVKAQGEIGKSLTSLEDKQFDLKRTLILEQDGKEIKRIPLKFKLKFE
ncbi:MAG: hypothetical protein ACR2NF_05895, partial [Pirellulales bacterium]